MIGLCRGNPQVGGRFMQLLEEVSVTGCILLCA